MGCVLESLTLRALLIQSTMGTTAVWSLKKLAKELHYVTFSPPVYDFHFIFAFPTPLSAAYL
jgi:hypothetical protein